MKFLKSRKFWCVLLVFTLLFIRHLYNQSLIFQSTDEPYKDISNYYEKSELSENEYIEIFKQTGVSPYAYNELKSINKLYMLDMLHKMYFNKPDIEQKYLCFPFTTMEYNISQKTPIISVKDGDILVNLSTSTLDWRHGHSAIVIDAEKDKTIEHTLVGGVSQEGSVSSWSTQPRFVVLRYEDEEVVSKVVKYAKENLLGVGYNIFVGIDGKKDKSDEKKKYASNCSHIVWQAFKSQGIDIDSNGGLFVTPEEIALCDKLKVVQIYGIDTKEYIDRILW